MSSVCWTSATARPFARLLQWTGRAADRGRRGCWGLGQPTRGLKAGVVVALDEAEQAVRGAVAQAERSAGVSVERCSCPWRAAG